MSDEDQEHGPPETGEQTETAERADEPVRPEETAWQRRKRLAAVFGDVLPETTSDERDESEPGTADEWLKRQVPPHHG